MFSSRFTGESHEPHPLWEARSALLAEGREILDLTRSNPTEAGITYPAGLPGLLARPSILRYRPDPRGLPAARKAVAAYLGTLGAGHGSLRSIHHEDLVLTASTSEAYALLFKLLADPGDEVLIPTPTYPLFDALAGLEHVDLVRYPLQLDVASGPGKSPGPAAAASPSRWRPDFALLRNLVSTRTKALILVTPNNPTGHIAGPDEIAGYLDLARDYGLALIVDEVFSEYLLGPARYHPVESDGPLVFTLNGLSKLAGLPQFKLGWIHVAGEKGLKRRALEHLEWIADAYLSVNTPVQEACADLLALSPALRAPIQARLAANLATATARLDGVDSIRPLIPEAGWSLVLAVEAGPGPLARDEDFALALLRRTGVHVHPGHLFGFEEGGASFHLVLSLLAPEADFREGLEQIITLRAAGSHG